MYCLGPWFFEIAIQAAGHLLVAYSSYYTSRLSQSLRFLAVQKLEMEMKSDAYDGQLEIKEMSD